MREDVSEDEAAIFAKTASHARHYVASSDPVL